MKQEELEVVLHMLIQVLRMHQSIVQLEMQDLVPIIFRCLIQVLRPKQRSIETLADSTMPMLTLTKMPTIPIKSTNNQRIAKVASNIPQMSEEVSRPMRTVILQTVGELG